MRIMNNEKVLVLVLAAMLLALTPAYGATEDGGGQSPYLMSDALLSFSDWTSIIANPALLTEVDVKTVSLGGYFLLQDAGYQYFSLAWPIGFRHTLAFSFFYAGLTNMDSYDQDGNLQGLFSFGEPNLMLSYGFRLMPFMSVGVNGYLIQRNMAGNAISNTSGLGLGGDVGVVFNPIHHYRYGNLNIGLCVQNTTLMEEVESLGSKVTSYTTNIKSAVSYRTLRDRLVLDGDVYLEDFLIGEDDYAAVNYDLLELDTPSVDSSVIPYDTTEYDTVYRSVKKSIPIRFGAHVKFFFLRGLGIKLGLNNNFESLVPNIGFILYAKRINVFRKMQITYDIGNKNHFGSWSENTHSLNFAFQIGKSREEIQSLGLYRKLIIAPMNDFNEAMRLYLAGKYWEASFAFGKVIAKYPAFHKIDMAALYMGKCYEYLQVNDAARAIYKDALKKYTTSDLRSRYIYQTQNLDYKEGKYEDALKNYALISNLYGTTDIKPDADYVAGQVYYKKKGYGQAKQVLSAVPAGNGNYGYAQYTLAIIALEEKKMDEAITHMSNVVAIVPKNNSERALQEAAYTKLGHLYYEEVKLKDAYINYSKVPVDSRFADEALLGSAWCFVKGNQYAKAIELSNSLISNCPKSLLLPEAYLVIGYCNTLQTDYASAKINFEKCISLCKKEVMSDDQIREKNAEFNSSKKEFTEMYTEIMSNALKRPNERILEERANMLDKYKQYQQTMREQLVFQATTEQISKFRRSKQKILKDAEYALATAIQLEQSGKKQEILDDYKKEEKEREDELERLQRELQELE